MKSLSIIIPVFNESGRIREAFIALESLDLPDGLRLEKIIFVDDGSIDQTRLKIENWINSSKGSIASKTTVISYGTNQGRGFAVKRGLEIVATDYALFLDADMSIPFSNIKKFMPHVLENYDLLIGSKKMSESKCERERNLLRKFLGISHSLLASALIGRFYFDVQGGFKILSKRFMGEVLNRSQINRWSFDFEIVFLATRLNFKVIEIPVIWKDSEKDSKIKNPLKEIVPAIHDMLRVRASWQKSLEPNIEKPEILNKAVNFA